jgi:hypothetical protein
MPIFLMLIRVGLLAWIATAQADTVVVGDFSSGDLAGWEEKSFEGATEYWLVTLDGRRVLRAVSNASASGLVKRVDIDLNQTPFLHWRWRVENTLKGTHEQTKQGDDYPARLYLIVSGGPLFWQTRAVNYVWSSSQPVGSSWPNAFASNAVMLAVRSGPAQAGQWVNERHDVRADFRRLLGQGIQRVDAVAIMTDTDNSGQRAVAYYSDIFFSGE